MKFAFAGFAAFAAAGLAILPCAPQSNPSPRSGQSAQQPGNTPSPMPGQVVLSRSADAAGKITTVAGQTIANSQSQPAVAPIATDAERQAIRFTAYDMDVHLDAARRNIAVRALLTVSNAGATPLKRIPLQISSSLTWDRIRVEGQDVHFPVAMLNSDADHTGQLHEAAVPLAVPLAPGKSTRIDVTYSGQIVAGARRPASSGAPGQAAFHADWDGIGADFTGLRGFGNVVWYPVSSVPALLGDGATLFDEIGRQKLRLTGSSFTLHLTDEFPQGHAPTLAVINGHAVPLSIAAPASGSGSADLPSVATASLSASTLGFQAPSFFLAVRNRQAVAANMTLWTLPEDDSAAYSWKAADEEVTPFLRSWLGDTPRAPITVLDLPDADDMPFEDGPFLATGVKSGSAAQIDGILSRALTHAYVDSQQAWLTEGLANFMGTLWIERRDGRAKALAALESSRQALALVEPESPGVSVGEPLTSAYTPAYYRTKAAYVLWMLRDLIGDKALAGALRAFDAARKATGAPGDPPPSFESFLKQAAAGRDLGWLFAQWVNADDGLPDLSIDHVYPSAAAGGNWLVAVDLSNSGYAAAEVPLTVKSGSIVVTRRVLIPAQGKIVKRILIQGEPSQVQLNDGSVPEVQASIHVTNLHSSSAANEPIQLR